MYIFLDNIIGIKLVTMEALLHAIRYLLIIVEKT